MAKRPAPAGTSEPESKAHKHDKIRQRVLETPEMGEFEDQWEDEIEDDENVVDGGEDGTYLNDHR